MNAHTPHTTADDRPAFDVFVGLDVGKTGHHAVALDRDGHRLHDAALPNSQDRLAGLFDRLARHGRLLVVVDQPANIGALAVAVARSRGHEVAYLPGLAMRRIADLHPGQAKTDARDAYVIADAARSLPHTLRRVDGSDEKLAELAMLAGFDDDLAGEATRLINRIRGLLTGIHPGLEAAIGADIAHPAVLALLERYGGPAGLAAAGRRRLAALAARHAPRKADRLVDGILAALATQTVTVAGAKAAETILPRLAASLRQVLDQRAEIGAEVQKALDNHPLGPVLTSMPGIGVRTGTRILIEVGDISAFPTPGHLAAYAGLAPVTRRSGTSIHGEHPPRGGNKRLKRALFLAAFASLPHPASRVYYDRKRAEGKRHNAALICLARRRTDVLFAMLRDHKPYQASRLPEPAAAAA